MDKKAVVHIQMEYYSAIKKNAFESVLMRWMKLEPVIQSEVGQKDREGNGNTPVLLPGESHGRRSLVGCSPRGHKESDMTVRLHSHFSLSRIGEGTGNPLQCSCLENPRVRGA